MLQLLRSSLQESKAKEALTRKQQKNRSKQQVFEENDKKVELLQKPREYQVKFTIPNPAPLNPPILGISSKYDKKVELLQVS